MSGCGRRRPRNEHGKVERGSEAGEREDVETWRERQLGARKLSRDQRGRNVCNRQCLRGRDPFRRAEHWVVGSIGRLAAIKNPLLLADAFAALVAGAGTDGACLRLAIVGDGELATPLCERLRAAGLENRVWMPGARADVAQILRSIDCFVLPSLAEGTSCTLQEAMASALPIVVTDVGGNRDLLAGGRLGTLVPSGDAGALASAIAGVRTDPGTALRGHAARVAIEHHYGLGAMLDRYAALFSRED